MGVLHAIHERLIRLCNRFAFARRLRLSRDELREASIRPVTGEVEDFRVSLPSRASQALLAPETIAALSRSHRLEVLSPAVLRRAEIVGGTVVVAKNGRIVDDSGMASRHYLERTNTSPILVARPFLPVHSQLEKVVPLTTAMSKYYYHWVAESLTRVQALLSRWPELRQDKRLTYVVDGPEYRFQIESLTHLFGISEHQIVPRAALGRRAIAGECYVPFYNKAWLPEERIELHPPSCFRSLSAHAWSLRAPRARNRIIAIDRPAHLPRSIENLELLKRAIPELDVLVLEDLPFVEQMEIFQSAQVVIAAHGAGLANLVFCREALVVELYPASGGHTSDSRDYVQLCSALGLRYHIRGCMSSSPNLRLRLSETDVSDIQRLVKNWLSGLQSAEVDPD